MASVLSLEAISKSFVATKALREVSFDLRAGEVHALLGENGAGKSTLIKIISGVHAPDTGEITLDGARVSFASPRDAARAGIATVYQELLLFPDLTVAENIYLGHAPRDRLGRLNWRKMRHGSRSLLDDLDSPDLDVDARVGSLSVANRQRVEIAKALSQDARFLIMDEPTAALTDTDARRLLDVIRRLRGRGVGIAYISHRIPEIFAIADRVTVLRDGALVGTLPIGNVTEPMLINMMVGRSIDQLFPKSKVAIGAPVLELRHVSHRDVVRDVSLTIRAGEILGIAGLIGSGRTELALTVFGITPATAGGIFLDGKPVAIGSPQVARDFGIAYVPEDRAQQGLIRSQTIRENISLALLNRIARWFFVERGKEARLAREAIARFGIRARGPEQFVRQLSGGNQQKVVLSKWVAIKPRVLIMDEPTRGIDVAAKAEIHALMSKLAGEGMAVLMISSDLPEVLGMSDRVLVMNGGAIVAEFDRADAHADAVGAAMTKASPGRAT